MLTSRAMPEKTRQVTAFFTPPLQKSLRVWIKWLTSLYTYGVYVYYTHRCLSKVPPFQAKYLAAHRFFL